MKLDAALDDKDGLEYLVDWNKAMIPQISKLGDNYFEWVNLPVDRPLRLFENDFLELTTKSTWYMPLLFWIPIIIALIIYELESYGRTFEMYTTILIQLTIGIFLWPILEYVVHRYIFHVDALRCSSLNTFHFVIHGNHHKVPYDKYRLVFPPIPAAFLGLTFYQILKLFQLWNFCQYPKLVFAGITIGYLCYDMTHYFIHFASPTSNYFYNLKRHHNNHHFVNHDKGFGISNSTVDGIFCSKAPLKKLNYRIKW